MSGTPFWSRFSHDPRQEQHAHLRAADRDRDVVNDLLSEAFSEGRLTPAELDERTDRVARARTLGELPVVVEDLVSPTGSGAVPAVPGDRRAEAERRYRKQRQEALFGFLTPTLICWVIWLVAWGPQNGGTPGFPWPAFVMIGTGMRWLQLTTGREDRVLEIERDLEKKERKRLEAERRRELPPGPDAPQAGA